MRERVSIAAWSAASPEAVYWLAKGWEASPIGTTRTRSAFVSFSTVAVIGVVVPVRVVNVMVPGTGVAVADVFDW